MITNKNVPPLELAQWQTAALHNQIANLRRELAQWRDHARIDQSLQKHNTQVERVVRQLDALLDKAGVPEPGTSTFAERERALRCVLGAHRIWDFFRAKLSLREVAWLRDDLVCADEFAWECYRPARDLARTAGSIRREDLKEPPLVFFASAPSPYARSRGSTLPIDIWSEDDAQDLSAAVLMLPIPVIGLPWFQLAHLPSTVVIGHEVGHAVEHDFGLFPLLEMLFSSLELPTDRRDAWLAWRHEVFADVYSILCSGRASLIALMEYLIADPPVIQKELRTATNWGKYPPRFLRIQLNLAVLRTLGLSDDGLGQLWASTYEFHLMSQFEPDIPKVVAALLDTPLAVFGGKALREVIAFTSADQSRAEYCALRVNRGLVLPIGEPVRRLFAAATLAYAADPNQYIQENANGALIDKIVAAIPPGVRNAEGTLSPQAIAVRDAADRAAGAQLLAFFS